MQQVIKDHGPDELPELGSRQAAVESCVSLIASRVGQPESILHYWLDLYYQVRLAYEAEEEQQRRRESAKLDAEQLRRAMEALRRISKNTSGATEGGQERGEEEKAQAETKAEGEAAKAGEGEGAEQSAPPQRAAE